MDDPLRIFSELSTSVGDDEKYVSVEVDLRKPFSFGFEIHGYLREEKHTKPEIFARKLERLNGVNDNFTFEMHGAVQHPEPFEGTGCDVLVNPLAGSDYIEHSMAGYVGDGWYEPDRFLFRLYISPDQAKRIIERRILAAEIESDPEYDEESEYWMHLRLDVVEFKRSPMSKTNRPIVSYRIIRLYS